MQWYYYYYESLIDGFLCTKSRLCNIHIPHTGGKVGQVRPSNRPLIPGGDLYGSRTLRPACSLRIDCPLESQPLCAILYKGSEYTLWNESVNNVPFLEVRTQKEQVRQFFWNHARHCIVF